MVSKWLVYNADTGVMYVTHYFSSGLYTVDLATVDSRPSWMNLT